jgi:hypothetical protein
MSAQHHSQRTIAPHLIRAYRNAQYFVHYGEEVLLLKVGFINHALGHLIKAQGKATAAFLTAYNPHSQPQDEAINAQAHERLLERLRAIGIAVIEGLGTDPDEDWDAEPSVLALGLTLCKLRPLQMSLGKMHSYGLPILRVL